MALANDGGFNFERVAKCIAAFLHLQGGQADTSLLIGQVPELRNLLSGRRLIPFLQRFPERFELIHSPNNMIVVKVLTPEEDSREAMESLKFAKDEQYNADLVSSLYNGIVFYMNKQDVEGAPLRWLYAHRSVPKHLKGWAMTHPNPAFNYHCKPGFGGYKDEAAARTASLNQYLKGFVDANPTYFKWVDRENGIVTIHEGIAPPEKRKDPEKIKQSVVGPQTVSPEDVLPGSYLLVVRMQNRTKDINNLEMSLMSQWAGLPHPPREVKAGLLNVPASDDSTKFVNNIGMVTSVRKCCTVLCSATTEEAFLHKIEQCKVPGGKCKVAFEMHYPEACPTTLPFHDVTAQAMLLSKVLGLLGTDRVVCEGEAENRLVLLCTKGFYVLCADNVSCGDVQEWNTKWEGRPFSFSGSMEAAVGSCIVSVGRLVWGILTGGGLIPDKVLDACCGSGTLAAAAAHQGAGRVVGYEIRSEFVPRIKENLEHCGTKDNVTVLCHDCTQAPPIDYTPSLVYCNAPWGKKFGTEEDCAKVVKGVLTHYLPTAVICFVIPRAVLDKLREEVPMEVLHHVPLGTVSLLVVKAA